tara:strand:+ start:5390 stop:5815 length:426 start_codon:yes stop_codon:yes gene_type:complete
MEYYKLYITRLVYNTYIGLYYIGKQDKIIPKLKKSKSMYLPKIRRMSNINNFDKLESNMDVGNFYLIKAKSCEDFSKIKKEETIYSSSLLNRKRLCERCKERDYNIQESFENLTIKDTNYIDNYEILDKSLKYDSKYKKLL